MGIKAFDILRRASPTVSVGAISANLMQLGSDISILEKAGAQVLHFDIMDGVFTPVMTVGPAFIKGIETSLLKDVHLMIEHPLRTISDYIQAGADTITLQVESTRHIHRALQYIGEAENVNDSSRDIVRGIALNPGTSLAAIEPLMEEIEMIMLLAVNPGWSKQPFISNTFDRIKQVKQLIAASKREILLCVDGAITRDNIAEVANAGVDLIVSGSAIFKNDTIADNLQFMLQACKKA